ncbi:hypothetical protein PRIPAC_76358 [Pristionchus pacificus]|uniref:Uncharacterized protein n=1 Tax=Pristionchus pacificus TaxID=54126 RepID=A0A2A6C6R2_PRIPA|nr:hypothetical protein PRIPAC_76358 [Pristionchus pacificus]|eukprot:PDM73711.1 hypothetical protein PRIPAC_41067 [Pristionchus pacificus]
MRRPELATGKSNHVEKYNFARPTPFKLVFSFRHQSPPLPAPLQSSLDSYSEWCSTWQMSVNPAKSHILHFGHVVKKAAKRVNFLFVAIKSANPVVLIHAYKVYARSILEYCSIIYSPHLLKDRKILEKVQYTFLRRLHFRCKILFASYSASCERFDLEPLDHRRDISTFKFIHALFCPTSSVSPSLLFEFRNSRTRGAARKLFPLFRATDNISKNFISHLTHVLLNSLPPGTLSLSSKLFVNSLLPRLPLSYLI